MIDQTAYKKGWGLGTGWPIGMLEQVTDRAVGWGGEWESAGGVSSELATVGDDELS